jgi:hypothetical protein
LAGELAAFLDNRGRLAAAAAPLREAAPAADPDATLPPAAVAATLPLPPAAPRGTVRYFGDYELLEEIARGGMGVVFRARQVSLNRTVALKMILAGQLSSPADVARFRAEAEAAANLDHPNIVPIHEVGEHAGQHYFSMKLIDGGSLAGRLAAPPRPPARELARLLVPVCRAVHFAHQRGILHRDLKPGNVLLDAAGTPYVTDFGLAKRVEGDSRLTQSGAIVGTPAYMPPEQAAAVKTLTTAADVYALGAILYECLTGRPPFRGDTPLDTLLQVIDREPVRPRSVNPAADRDLETVALKCLAKEPAKRYASADALADDLDRWLGGEPILARPARAAERAWKWAKRRPAFAGLVLSLLLVTLGGFAGMTALYLRAEDALRLAAARADAEVAARADVEAARRTEAGQRRRAEDALTTAEQRLYYNRVALAERYWQADNVGRADVILDSCSPPLRHWEWHYLKRLCHAEHLRLPDPLAAYSPDGRLLATSSDGDVRLRDAATGEVRLTWRANGVQVNHLAFSPDSTRLAAACGDRTVRVLETGTGSDTLKLTWPAGFLGIALNPPEITHVAWSPDGKRLAAAAAVPNPVQGGYKQDEVRIWDSATGKLDRTIKDAGLCVEFSPDGRRLATAGWEPAGGYVLKVVESATGKQTLAIPTEGYFDGSLAFSPDGRWIASARRGRSAHVWDASTGREGKQLGGHAHEVVQVALSRDGQRLASGDRAGVVKVWDVADGRELAIYRGHTGQVIGLEFHPAGRFLVSGSEDGTARLWDTSAGQGARAPDRWPGQRLRDPAEPRRPDRGHHPDLARGLVRGGRGSPGCRDRAGTSPAMYVPAGVGLRPQPVWGRLRLGKRDGLQP